MQTGNGSQETRNIQTWMERIHIRTSALSIFLSNFSAGHTEAALLLISHPNTDVNRTQRSAQSATVLILAAETANVEVAKALLDGRSDLELNHADSEGRTALSTAVGGRFNFGKCSAKRWIDFLCSYEVCPDENATR